MTDKTGIERVVEDVKLRNCELAGVIVVDKATRELKVITYDRLGLVNSITAGDNVIELFGKATANTNAMRPLGTLSAVE